MKNTKEKMIKSYRIEFIEEYLGDITGNDPFSTELFIWVLAESAQEAVDTAFASGDERVFIEAMDAFVDKKIVKSYSEKELELLKGSRLMTSNDFETLLN